MPTPTPTPYRNLQMDIANEEDNAEHLQLGIEDAKARLKAASEQYKAMPGIPQEKIRDKAVQDLLDRTNRLEKVKSKAKEMEVPEKPSNFDLGSIINAFVPSAGAATLSETTGGPTFHPPMATPQAPVQKAAQAVQGLRAAGIGQIGDKAQVDEKTNSRITETKPYLIDKNDVDTIGEAFRGTPEWQRQDRGLNDLEHLVQLDAQRNAGKSNIDLSALGAYEDAQNSRYGIKSNLQSGLKGTPIEDTSLKDMGEIQRRRGDMAKELINTIKASKVGQLVTQDGQVVGYTGGVAVPKPSAPSTAGARLDQSNWRLALAEKHKLFDKSDTALGSLNTLVRELGEQIPSDLNRTPIQRAMVDMNGMRPALAEVMMESGNQTLYNKMGQIMDKYFTKGTYLTDRDLKEFWESSRSALKAMQADRVRRASQLKNAVSGYGIDDRTFNKIASPDYIRSGTTSNLDNMPEAIPQPHKKGATPAGGKPLSAEDMAAIMNAVNGSKK